ncbi:cytochrome P450 [Glaciimonas soli]|uniref:cytochrome P450 n=1 Tax=Glaciimonas soli TaxID=2590999 RepID=UPI001D177F55|nr:cytochrome P450 [Glaciimonas soli]
MWRAWLLTNYADVANVLRDPNFSVQRASRWINGSGPGARAELREFKRILSRSLIFLDGSQHTRLRQVMNAGFKPAALQSMGSRVQLIVDRLLDSLDANDEMDFIRDFARPLPAMVIADMLGVNASDHADFIACREFQSLGAVEAPRSCSRGHILVSFKSMIIHESSTTVTCSPPIVKPSFLTQIYAQAHVPLYNAI